MSDPCHPSDAPGGSDGHQWLFRTLHNNQLVYNATWEDPRIDRELLGIDSDSEVVAITSAGCNILDMLLDRPKAIHAVDLNPRQNLLLELKVALIRAGDFWDLFQFFGIGSHPERDAVLERLRPHLRPEALDHWRTHVSMFSPRGWRPSFYWKGTAGLAASLIWLALAILRVRLRALALDQFDARTLDCCPNYLRREHQEILASHLSRITCHTTSISNFLREHPGSYSHYVLLDHQDWLAWKDPVGLREEWDLVLANSRPGTRILLRSAGLDCRFIPGPIQTRLRFRPDLTEPLHRRDRVGT